MTQEETNKLRLEAEQLAKAHNPKVTDVLNLVKRLKQADDFITARRLLNKVRTKLKATATKDERIRLAQEHSLCTYKDVNLPAGKRYPAALKILEEIGLRSPTCKDKETLGQGGAIYKRLWETEGKVEDLLTALAFYRAGWERDPEHDKGWCGVNAAYLLDLLVFQETTRAKRTGVEALQVERWKSESEALRRDMLEKLEDKLSDSQDYWELATLAEIHFGLGEYSQAGAWLAKAKQTGPDGWELQSTAKQLAGIARLQQVPLPESDTDPAQWHPAWKALRELLGDDTTAAMESWRGKVGLALSGGGFRAALFHLGVLARLAECDVLRSVETLSTVSGGSILGAHYYLELRQLLQSKHDTDIAREDYVALVKRLIIQTMAGTEKNLRVRALANLWYNLKMIFHPSYSRSNRIGELYETHLFNQVKDDKRGTDLRCLCDLLIQPFTTNNTADEASFKPRIGNWLRHCKVPNLMLNTTSLNTGHNWHFTARWMGEPPGLIGDEIDMNERYRRLYYENAPTKAMQSYPLAYGVAASSCVPALFEPLPLKGLYPGRTVRLVDGGVHDNQGIGGLLDDDCNFIFCSDASGQMDSQTDPSNGLLGVFWRSDGILQDRVREAQHRHVRVLADSGALQGLFFIHLRQELETTPVDYIDSKDPQYELCEPSCTSCGMDRELQRLLSEIRTDLDSFTEIEAYALMASGYLMTARQLQYLNEQHQQAGLPGQWGGFDIDAPQWRDAEGGDYWPFTPLLPILGKSPESSDHRRHDLARQLKTGSMLFGRVWQLVDWLKTSAILIGVVLAVLALIWIRDHWNDPLSWTYSTNVSVLVIGVILMLAGMISPAFKYLNYRKASQSALMGVVVAITGWLGSNIHLYVFEPLLRQRGRLSRLMKLPVGK